MADDSDDSGALRRQASQLLEISKVASCDASNRADMWRDFGFEFMRLGRLATAMRGPGRIADAAFVAAQGCLDAMLAEIDVLRGELELIQDRSMPQKEEPYHANQLHDGAA